MRWILKTGGIVVCRGLTNDFGPFNNGGKTEVRRKFQSYPGNCIRSQLPLQSLLQTAAAPTPQGPKTVRLHLEQGLEARLAKWGSHVGLRGLEWIWAFEPSCASSLQIPTRRDARATHRLGTGNRALTSGALFGRHLRAPGATWVWEPQAQWALPGSRPTLLLQGEEASCRGWASGESVCRGSCPGTCERVKKWMWLSVTPTLGLARLCADCPGDGRSLMPPPWP